MRIESGDDMNLKQIVGLRIKELRQRNKFTQSKLSELVEITPKHQSCIEMGKNYPSAELIEKYAKVFQMKSTEVLYLEEKPSKQVLITKITEKLNKTSYEKLLILNKILG